MTEFGTERPVEDVLEQRAELDNEPSLEPIDELPPEAAEADVVEQHRTVPIDDEPEG